MNPPERPFEVVCIKCLREAMREQKPYKGLVNHNYVPLKEGSILIQYRCFTCESKYELEINGFNPKQTPPINKEDFKNKLGIKEEFVN